jgi:molecular chaperone HtpG
MTDIRIPTKLERLLRGHRHEGPLKTLAKLVGQIVYEQKMTFFPDFTDHGADHINSVLTAGEKLIPHAVLPRDGGTTPALLTPEDVTLFVAATLLHDLGMFIHPCGFKELISEETKYRPIDWFDTDQEHHRADRPWPQLWQEFVREAQRFDEQQIVKILGADALSSYQFRGLNGHPDSWSNYDRKVIGEFIRRHHARIAHEIAIYGFPGLDSDFRDKPFPQLKDVFGHQFADLIGATARSHGIPLRVGTAYVNHITEGVRCHNAAVPYSMALLRISDYMQIEKSRTPAILLHLKQPESQATILEWSKHKVVQSVEGSLKNKNELVIQLNSHPTHAVHMALYDLLQDFQQELDTTTAVLEETYGSGRNNDLRGLKLTYHRITSDLNRPTFLKRCTYVPERTGFTASATLLNLLVAPLYGNSPSVGVRELLQNAVDAVREHVHLVSSAQRPLTQLCPLPPNLSDTEFTGVDPGTDVLLDFIERAPRKWILRIQDRGRGMTESTISDYFLRAGASFRHSPQWSRDFVDCDGRSSVLRTGKFGIGVYAIFLLGHSFRLYTRHWDAAPQEGLHLSATRSDHSVIIRRMRENRLPIGTTIEVDLEDPVASALNLSQPDNINAHNWYCNENPRVLARCIRINESVPYVLPQSHVVPLMTSSTPEWSSIEAKGFNGIQWTHEVLRTPRLSCNGIVIRDPRKNLQSDAAFSWPLGSSGISRPAIAVEDPDGRLDLTATRYSLSSPELPFTKELVRDVILSYIGFALIHGPGNPSDAINPSKMYPLTLSEVKCVPAFHGACWCFSSIGFSPINPWFVGMHKRKTLNALQYIRNSSSREADDVIRRCLRIACKKTADTYSEAIWILGAVTIDPRDWIDKYSMEPDIAAASDSIFELFWDDSWTNIQLIERIMISQGRPGSQEAWVQEVAEERRGLESCEELMISRFEVKSVGEPSYDELTEIWNECLGRTVIPFDDQQRQELIKKASRHERLAYHITKWRQIAWGV